MARTKQTARRRQIKTRRRALAGLEYTGKKHDDEAFQAYDQSSVSADLVARELSRGTGKASPQRCETAMHMFIDAVAFMGAGHEHASSSKKSGVPGSSSRAASNKVRAAQKLLVKRCFV